MSYISQVLENIKAKENQAEFLQAVEEVLSSLGPAVEQNEELYKKYAILERLTEPDRQIIFRVAWTDDLGNTQVNKGYRVQFNNAIGPYKGGLRFHPTVNLSVMKFLAFEQTLKNSLTSLPMGGAKGGSDFDPRGKSDGEIMRFCQSFMTELYRHIGAQTDVPAGDLGVGAKEIGYLFGAYKRIIGAYENGVITGKGLSYGGSLIRPEATGFGAVYFLREIMKRQGEEINGKTFILSGYGNVTWGSCLKINELGGKVVTLSGHDGFIYDEEGVKGEKVEFLKEMRAKRLGIKAYADKYGVPFYPNQKPWGKIKGDVVMPCATQNEIDIEDAKAIVQMGIKYVVEVANMPTKNDALKYLVEKGVILAPAKAANAGGVAVSGLEMSQNSLKLAWTREEVDEKLSNIMVNIHNQILAVCQKYNLGYDLVRGANIAGFEKVAEAMIAEGVY